MRDCTVAGWSSVAVHVRNLYRADSGDSSISGCSFVSGGAIGILQESSGRLRIANPQRSYRASQNLPLTVFRFRLSTSVIRITLLSKLADQLEKVIVVWYPIHPTNTVKATQRVYS
jgi:hypothetical protein